MSTFAQHKPRRFAPQSGHPAWLRCVALFCAVIFAVASTAQAAHIHGIGLWSGTHKVQSPDGGSKPPADEEHCPLCVAAHWALPANLTVAPAPMLAMAVLPRQCTELHAHSAWHFARFSRPPPMAAPVVG